MVPEHVSVGLTVASEFEVAVQSLATVASLLRFDQRRAMSLATMLNLPDSIPQPWRDLFPFVVVEHGNLNFTPAAVE